MRTCLLSLLLITSVAFGNLSAANIPLASPAAVAAAQPQSTPPEPLPRGCGSVTPPGNELAACCINGFVYMDGAIIAGAEVTITSPRGASVVLNTQVYSGTESRPFYQLSLSAAPLNVQTGETITVTAHYSSHTHSLSYLVQPGSQQVDVVLERKSQLDYTAAGKSPSIGEPGKVNWPSGIAVGQGGRIYVVDREDARIQVFNNAGTYQFEWGSHGNLPGQFAEPWDVAVDPSGNVYVTDSIRGVVQKFTAEGVFITAWGRHSSSSETMFSTGRLAIDKNYNVFIVDGSTDRIYHFNSTGKLLDSWQSDLDNDNYSDSPYDIAVDSDGNIYVSDNKPRIQKFSPTGSLLAAWVGDHSGSAGLFCNAGDIAFDGRGSLYIVDICQDRVHRLVLATGEIDAGWGLAGINNGEQGAHLDTITVDSQGRIFTAEGWWNYRMQVFDSAGVRLNSWGSKSAAPGQLDRADGITFDSTGQLFVADYGNHRIQVFTRDGKFIRAWGSYGETDGLLYYPRDVAVNSSGNVYVLDLKQRVQKFRSDGVFLRSWGSRGSAPGQLTNAVHITIDRFGNIYVADYDLNRIQKFDGNGNLLGMWGDSIGPGQLTKPADLLVDNDRLYVINSESRKIEVYSLNGTWITTIGNGLQFTFGFFALALHSQNQLLVLGSILNYRPDSNIDTMIYHLKPDGSVLNSWSIFEGAGLGEIRSATSADLFAQWLYVNDAGSQIKIFRPMTYTKPIATITHVSAPSIGPGDTLTLHGLGQDSDETPGIAAYRWTSDKDGVIGTGATLTRAASTLKPGSQHITFAVQDGEGEWSDLASTNIYVAAPPQVTWTALLYLAGDYGDRGKQLDGFNDALAKLATTLHNSAIRVVAQVDGPADGDTYRMLIIPGSPPKVTRLEDIGEKAMDSPAALAEFLRWGQGSFPSQHYYLAIANHGQAIQGIAWDLTSDLKDDRIPNDSAYLTSAELGQALRAEGVAPVDIIHLDACSMNLLEVAYELRPLADAPAQSRLLIASQYLGWNYFAYDTYINAIGAGDTPAQVALSVASAYAERAKADRVPYTIAALDVGRAGPIATAVDNLGAEMAAYVNNDRSRLDAIESIWQASPHFESNGDYLNNALDEYVDLPTWASKVQLGVASPAVKQRAFDLISELSGPSPFILPGSNHVGHGNLPLKYAAGAFIDLSGASGVSIFYPGRQDTVAFDSYVNNRIFAFTSATRWADFLLSGIGNQAPGPRKPLSGPLASLDRDYHVILPMIER